MALLSAEIAVAQVLRRFTEGDITKGGVVQNLANLLPQEDRKAFMELCYQPANADERQAFSNE